MESEFILHGIQVSQPTRSIMMYFTLLGQKYEFRPVNLFKGEHRSEEFAKINPVQLVPALTHGEFNLGEAAAILFYLARACNDRKYYPDDPKQAAKIHMYFSYHGGAVRPFSTFVFRDKYRDFLGKFLVIPPKEEGMKLFEDMCYKFEDIWLKSNDYLCGNELTIADLLAFTEFQQSLACNYDFSEKFPKISAWLKRIYAIPAFKDCDTPLKEKLAFFDQMLKEKTP